MIVPWICGRPLRLLAATAFVTCFAAAGVSTPLNTVRGDVLPEGKNEIKVKWTSRTFDGRYDANGDIKDFANSESRKSNVITLGANYGSVGGQEICLELPFVMRTHVLSSASPTSPGATKSISGLGDITLLGKSQLMSNQDIAGASFSMGVKFPTGRSLFNTVPDKLPSGSGTWDFISGMYTQERRGVMLLCANVEYHVRFSKTAGRFGGYDIKAGNVKVTPGDMITASLAAEYPASDLIKIIAEANAEYAYSGKASYVDGGNDAFNDIRRLGEPEYFLENSKSILLSIQALLALSPAFGAYFSYQVPVLASNAFSGGGIQLGLSLQF